MTAHARRHIATAVLAVTACGRGASNPAPPRVTAPTGIPAQASTIVVPLAARIADRERLVNAEVPATLTTLAPQIASFYRRITP